MKSLMLFLLAFLLNCFVSAQVLKTTNAKLSFFSKAPIEDIYAVSGKGLSAIDLSSGSIYFKVPIRSFEFAKELMQEHFNENYLESDKYPYAEFKGKFDRKIDLNSSGAQSVKVSGNLTVHNITRSYSVPAKITVKNGSLIAKSEFPVALVDHKVKIPRILIKNIAEVVLVTVSASYDLSSDVVGESVTLP